MSDLLEIGQFLLGAVIPLFLTLLVPPTSQRIGACIYALVGIALFVGLLTDPSTFAIGLGVGFMLAASKLAFGLRFIL